MRNKVAEAAKLPPEVVLWFVEAREVDPPADVTPAHWRLLTTHGVTTLAEATRITYFYRQRWTIEQLFRVMKTKGFDIEAVRIADEKPFENLVAATLIAAVSVPQMVRERDGAAKRPMEDVLDSDDKAAVEAICETLEGKTERQKNPHPKGFPGLYRMGPWTPGRMEHILRTTGTGCDSQWFFAIENHAARLAGLRKCVNLVGPGRRMTNWAEDDELGKPTGEMRTTAGSCPCRGRGNRHRR